MIRRAFRMQLYKGFEEDYQKRHAALWPELEELLHNSGIHRYSIFLDPVTNTLFGYMEVEDLAVLEKLPEHPVMKRWWAYMRDIMESNPDNSPVTAPLKEVFYLP